MILKEFITPLLIFISVAVADIIWVFYIRRIGEGKALSASLFGTAIWLLGAYAVVNYVKDIKLIIPAALGGFVGTYIAVRYDVYRIKKDKSDK